MSDQVFPQILAVTNQKGGVGKTTTSINLGASLAILGKRVLLVDLDPQGNASTGLGIGRSDREGSSYDVLMGAVDLGDAIRPTTVRNLDIVPGTADLSSVDLELATDSQRTSHLHRVFSEAGTMPYAFILIDCPPALNMLTVNALMASDAVIVPLQCEFFALEGISQLLSTISDIRAVSPKALRTQGVVLTMYDQRNNLTIDVENDVRDTLGDLVFRTVIPRNVRLSEAPSHGIPALVYDPRSSGAQAYVALARELLQRSGGQDRSRQDTGVAHGA